MRTLIINPDAATLNASFNLGSVGTGDLALRVRKGFENQPARIQLSWTVHGLQYNYLRAFFRRGTGNGALPFIVNIPNGKQFKAYKAKVNPGSLNIDGTDTIEYGVSVEISAVPL